MNKKSVNKKKLGKKCRESMMKQGDNMNQEMKMKGKRWLTKLTMTKVSKSRRWKMRDDILKRSLMDSRHRMRNP